MPATTEPCCAGPWLRESHFPDYNRTGALGFLALSFLPLPQAQFGEGDWIGLKNAPIELALYPESGKIHL